MHSQSSQLLKRKSLIKLGIGVQDKDVSKMAEILLAGGKMLSKHCPTCGSPLFEFGGRTLCPVCSKGEVSKEEKPEEIAEPETGKPPRGRLERALLKKLDELAGELERETNPRSMSEILELMKSTLEILEKVREG